MSLQWMAGQLAVRRNGLGLEVPRYNPHPAGALQEGGASKDVLGFLKANEGRFFTFNQILVGTGRTAKSVDWACIYLRSLGHVECTKDDGRNSRYLRYRYVDQSRGIYE